jgi:hypothetical protein
MKVVFLILCLWIHVAQWRPVVNTAMNLQDEQMSNYGQLYTLQEQQVACVAGLPLLRATLLQRTD